MGQISHIGYTSLPAANSFGGGGNDATVDCLAYSTRMFGLLIVGQYLDEVGNVLTSDPGRVEVVVQESDVGGFDDDDWTTVATFPIISVSSAGRTFQVSFTRSQRYVRTKRNLVDASNAIYGCSVQVGDIA